MHMQWQHWQRDADHQKCNQDDAHDRQQGRYRTTVWTYRDRSSGAFRAFPHGRRSPGFERNCGYSFRRSVYGHRVYRLIVNHGS